MLPLMYNHNASSEKKTVLVTGANGQLGMTFRNHEAEYSELNFVFMGFENLDITDSCTLRKVFMEIRPEYCINCAAYTDVEKAEEEPDKAILINAQAVLNLAITCKEFQTILIHVSTDYVFDGRKTTPYTIEDIPNPINVYGASKLHGELNIKKTLDRFFIIRTSWLYSKKFGKNFYRSILALAKIKPELEITDTQIGCPTDTVNLSRFILGLIINQNNNFGIHHFSDRIVMTWYDFAKIILEENNIHNVRLIKSNNYYTKAERPPYSVLDS